MSMELFDETKGRLRAIDSEYLRSYVETITKKSQGKNKYNCPFCHSGTGKSKTGAFTIYSKNHEMWQCYSCRRTGDIFDLVGEYENIPEPINRLKRVCEIYRIDLDTDGMGQSPRGKKEPAKGATRKDMERRTEAEENAQEDLTHYFEECHKRLDEYSYHTGRGLFSKKIADRFKLGYDPNFTKNTGGEVWLGFVIPTSKYTAEVRNTKPNVPADKRYRKLGDYSVPFNIEALQTSKKPIYIVEGEIDALSIMEVGGVAIGIGGTPQIGNLLKRLKEQRPEQPLVIALDNDEHGKPANDELAQGLNELEITWYKLDIFMGCKDANEALLKDREAFKREVARAEHLEDEADREKHLQSSALHHLQEFVNGIAESINNPPQKTGFTKLDKALDGGLYEGLYILGAITSLGKTTLAMQISDQIARQGRDVLIFSLEMARAELMSKSISRLTFQDVMADKNGSIRDAKTARGITDGTRRANYSQIELELIERSIIKYGEFAQHIYIQEGIGDIGVHEIRKAVRQHMLFTGNKPVVIIDYIQILAPIDSRATDKSNMDRAILELKKISRDYKLPLIGISSLNRASYNSGKVSLDSFKESGAIEYGSDVLMGLQYAQESQSDDERKVELVILKNRNGKTNQTVQFAFYAPFNCFEEV